MNNAAHISATNQSLTNRLRNALDSSTIRIKTSETVDTKNRTEELNDNPGDENYFNTINSPYHVQDFLDNFQNNAQLNLVRNQNAIALGGSNEARGAEFPDGSHAALIQLSNSEIFVLSDNKGNTQYFLLNNNGKVDQPIDHSASVFDTHDSDNPSLTFTINAQGNLKVDGLQSPPGLASSSAVFEPEKGLLTVLSFPELLSGATDIRSNSFNIYADPELDHVKKINHLKLDSVRNQSVININDHVTLSNAEFLDGSRAALITFDDTELFMIENSIGEKRYYEVLSNGELSAPLLGGNQIISDGPQSLSKQLALDSSGNLLLTETTPLSGKPANTVSIDAQTNQLSTTAFGNQLSGSDFTNQSESSIWAGAILQTGDPADNDILARHVHFDHYANTVEGQAILSAEGKFFTPTKEVDQRLFVARVLYNRGQGGVELFEEFMPDRTALLDNSRDLKEYDIQLDRALAHVQKTSRVIDTGEQLDASMQFVVASSITESLGHSPELMDAVLSDIDAGWHIEYDSKYGGLYSTIELDYFNIDSAKIHLTLEDFLTTYTGQHPNPLYNVMPHELAHSLDSYATLGGDGIPTGMTPADAEILVREREKLFAIFDTGGGTSNFRPYAFENIKEFWGEVSTYYLTGDANAKLVWEASPDLFNVLQRFYGLNYTFTA